ncbi:hypothetical protein TrVFT333_006201 [Trichoderma virens FT-333]|nr:hypothetical protein TrVFT333_006201 [Trichoderma virens FT-333]
MSVLGYFEALRMQWILAVSDNLAETSVSLLPKRDLPIFTNEHEVLGKVAPFGGNLAAVMVLMFAPGNCGHAAIHTHMQVNPAIEHMWPCVMGGERLSEAYAYGSKHPTVTSYSSTESGGSWSLILGIADHHHSDDVLVAP